MVSSGSVVITGTVVTGGASVTFVDGFVVLGVVCVLLLVVVSGLLSFVVSVGVVLGDTVLSSEEVSMGDAQLVANARQRIAIKRTQSAKANRFIVEILSIRILYEIYTDIYYVFYYKLLVLSSRYKMSTFFSV